MATNKRPAGKTSKVKAVVKRTPRTVTNHREELKNDIVTSKPQETSSQKIESKETHRRVNKTSVTIGLIVLVLLLLYLFRSAFIVAFVNGQAITRNEFTHQMEKDAGKQAMNEILTKDLVFQEAQKKHITVSDAEVNKEMSTIQDTLKKQGQSLDTALAAKGLSRQDLLDQIKVKIIVDKLLGPQIKITDQQVNDYLDKNKDSMPQGGDTNSLKVSIKQRMYQDQLSTKFQEWIQNLQKNAKINYLDKSLAQ